jgi:hypothetical protein
VKGLDTLEMGSPFGFTGNYPLYLTSKNCRNLNLEGKWASSGTARKLSRSKEDLDYTQLRVVEAHRGVGKVD